MLDNANNTVYEGGLHNNKCYKHTFENCIDEGSCTLKVLCVCDQGHML